MEVTRGLIYCHLLSEGHSFLDLGRLIDWYYVVTVKRDYLSSSTLDVLYGDMAYVLSFPGFKGSSSTCSNTFPYLHSYHILIIDEYLSKTHCVNIVSQYQ